MVGFVLFGLCFCLLLFMVLRLLCWLLVACLSFALLSVGWFGLVVSLLLMLVLYLVCWMGLLVVTLCFALLGFGFVFFVGFLPCGLLELIVLIVFWIWSVRVVVVMGLFIFLFQVLLRLVSGGSSFPCLASAWFAFTQ